MNQKKATEVLITRIQQTYGVSREYATKVAKRYKHQSVLSLLWNGGKVTG
jgi:hypothetical protein